MVINLLGSPVETDPAGPQPAVDPYLFWQLASGAFTEAKKDHYALVLLQFDPAKPEAVLKLEEFCLPSHCNAMRAGFKIVSALVDLSSDGADGPSDFFRLLVALMQRNRGLLGMEFGGFVPRSALKWPPFQRYLRSTHSPSSDPIALNDLRREIARRLNVDSPPKKGPSDIQPDPLCRGVAVKVAVVDDRCSVHSAAIQGPSGSAVASMWHQGGDSETVKELDDAPTEQWEAALSLDVRAQGGLIGRRLAQRATSISRLPSARVPASLPPPLNFSHGAAVMHLIAAPNLWVGKLNQLGQWIGIHKVTRCAPTNVHVVQLPIPTVVDTASRSLSCYVLDAIHDTLEQTGSGQPVVVNISFGTHGGGHDGSSMFEHALVELLNFYNGQPDRRFGGSEGRRPVLHIVLPAGNTHLWRCHASAMIGKERSHTFHWQVLPDDNTDNFMEVWVPDLRGIELEVTLPTGKAFALQLSVDKQVDYKALSVAGDLGIGAIIAPKRPTQSAQGRMVLIALLGSGQMSAKDDVLERQEVKLIAARDFRLKRSPAPAGAYCVQVRAPSSSEAFRVHAWIQRGDAAPLRGRASRGFHGRQSYFLDPGDGSVDPYFTLNGIATAWHDHLFVVGAMRQLDNRLSPYSTAGPNRNCTRRTEGPDWVVHADQSRQQPGLLVSSFSGRGWYRVSGTSMAAAVLTRHLYEHLAQGKTAESFRFPEQYCEEDRDLVPAGAPTQADPVFRGLWKRIVPSTTSGTV
jgi:hypothetical protein